MDLTNLFKLQKNLDRKIIEEQNLQNQSLISEKILALQVEISELANKTGCFKFWNNKRTSMDNMFLDELVNSLYFLLSLGLEKDFNDIDSIQLKQPKASTISQFLNIHVDINDFIVCSSKDHYITLFEDFLSLASSLGYSPEKIEKYYNDIYTNCPCSNKKQYS